MTTSTNVAQSIADTLTEVFVRAGISGTKPKMALKARQGPRNTYMLSVPVGELLDMVEVADNTSEERANRPIDQKWLKSIETGLGKKFQAGPGGKYVIFPITANVLENTVTFHSLSKGEGGLADIGILEMPQALRCPIADGQHRVVVLRRLAQQYPWLRGEAVNLFLIEESDVGQQRTDFADGGKTLPISPSLRVFFDSGVTLNAVTHILVARGQQFSEVDVERFKNSITGKRNATLWTYNNLRGYVGASLVGGTPGKTEELADSFDRAVAQFGWSSDGPELDTFAAEIAEYLDYMLQRTAGSALTQARERPDLWDWDELRSKSLILKAAGISTFAVVVHALREKAKEEAPGSEHEWVLQRVRELAELDWSQTSDTFRGTLVQGSRIASSTSAVYNAAVILRAKLGILDTIPRRTADHLLELIEERHIIADDKESQAIRVARRED